MLAPEHREWSRKIRVQIPQADNKKGCPGEPGRPFRTHGEDLATFEASPKAKKDLVATLEHTAARHDYLLGIRDDLPADSTANKTNALH
ncbi:hypothetical protein E5206_12725 [Arthrobacter sp. PAMC25564]|uniref:hypothetical protein n=1 Tax=Arthrobacter sp. PAMC25564 TaxID=2565366 RepID=UPI0010A299CC|nr:hypothetical protein [Arthrobacter sp. PAMC25564]QCB97675.1 hypothetical protein E5206_12725 [Arthrobacter sp. PAMC25564]